MHILLTNDDGIRAIGLRSLYQALVAADHRVTVVAPMTEQSAVGHAVTMFSPLRLKLVEEAGFVGHGVSGTPADCVKLALASLLDSTPDRIVSGINSGANVGVDILYSGTVSAATEGALTGIPALAVSVDDYRPTDLAHQARFAASFLESPVWENLPERCVLNLNLPAGPFSAHKPLRVCPQTTAVYSDEYDIRIDPRGNPYYWLHGQIPRDRLGPGTDRELLDRGHITLTPLRFDFTDHALLDRIAAVCAPMDPVEFLSKD
ncbi:MAG: 5'/3'-nucleotidase SurE [Deltaproteobacteria bacterium]|nr:5'/3'-nucleotidase SurE [Deltaproteobacteria bacterium]